MLLEIAVFNIESALAAASAGANRIELCSAPSGGGLTPSAGTMRIAREKISIPIYCMIRPREGDFCYSNTEFETMLYEIDIAKTTGMNGIVAGILLPDGSVDIKRMKTIVKTASPMGVTFHRAFDLTRNLKDAMESIIETGCKRILTSGGEPTAEQGISSIQNLISESAGRIIIMPGSGIRANNILHLIKSTCAHEIHLSARKYINGSMLYRTKNVSMASNNPIPDYEIMTADTSLIQEILRII